MLSYMILDMATMKIDLFWDNEQLQSNYALDPTNGNVCWYRTSYFGGLLQGYSMTSWPVITIYYM